MRVIDLPTSEKKFLTREELELIQKKVNLVPPCEFEITSRCPSEISLNDEVMMSVYRLGLELFYKDAHLDVQKLIDHILLADKENDKLLQQIKEKQEQINLLTKKIQKPSKDEWKTDF